MQEVSWAGELSREGKFIVNGESPSTLSVTIFNPLYWRTKLENITGLERVTLQVSEVLVFVRQGGSPDHMYLTIISFPHSTKKLATASPAGRTPTLANSIFWNPKKIPLAMLHRTGTFPLLMLNMKCVSSPSVLT